MVVPLLAKPFDKGIDMFEGSMMRILVYKVVEGFVVNHGAVSKLEQGVYFLDQI